MTLMTAVHRFLNQDEWPFQIVNDDTIRTNVSFTEHNFNGVIQADENTITVTFFVPFKIAASKRTVMLEYINLVNHYSRFANMEMDPADGEVSMRNGLWWEEKNPPSDDTLKMLIYATCTRLEEYTKGINKVIHANVSPTVVIEEIVGKK